MTNALSPWYTGAEMVEWDALKYVGDDSLHGTTHEIDRYKFTLTYLPGTVEPDVGV